MKADKPIKDNHMKKFILILFYKIFFVSFMFAIPIAYFVHTTNLSNSWNVLYDRLSTSSTDIINLKSL